MPTNEKAMNAYIAEALEAQSPPNYRVNAERTGQARLGNTSPDFIMSMPLRIAGHHRVGVRRAGGQRCQGALGLRVQRLPEVRRLCSLSATAAHSVIFSISAEILGK